MDRSAAPQLATATRRSLQSPSCPLSERHHSALPSRISERLIQQQSENGRYFKHGVVSGELSDNGRSFESSIARCIALVQVQDADGPRRRRRCEEQRRTLGRRRTGRQRRGGDTIGRVPVLGGCERLWQLRLRGVRQLQERALVQLQAESLELGTQQPQAWPR